MIQYNILVDALYILELQAPQAAPSRVFSGMNSYGTTITTTIIMSIMVIMIV